MLKVLPDSFAGDPDRRTRFMHEAQTLALLESRECPGTKITNCYGLRGQTWLTGVVRLLPAFN